MLCKMGIFATLDLMYRRLKMNKYCSNCGAELKERADVCLKCGKLVRKSSINLQTDIPEGRKSKIVAALLAFFLGVFGVHNFYLGYTGKGIAQLIITVFGVLLIIGPLVSYVWAIIELVCILTGSIKDSEGNDLL